MSEQPENFYECDKKEFNDYELFYDENSKLLKAIHFKNFNKDEKYIVFERIPDSYLMKFFVGNNDFIQNTNEQQQRGVQIGSTLDVTVKKNDNEKTYNYYVKSDEVEKYKSKNKIKEEVWTKEEKEKGWEAMLKKVKEGRSERHKKISSLGEQISKSLRLFFGDIKSTENRLKVIKNKLERFFKNMHTEDKNIDNLLNNNIDEKYRDIVRTGISDILNKIKEKGNNNIEEDKKSEQQSEHEEEEKEEDKEIIEKGIYDILNKIREQDITPNMCDISENILPKITEIIYSETFKEIENEQQSEHEEKEEKDSKNESKSEHEEEDKKSKSQSEHEEKEEKDSKNESKKSNSSNANKEDSENNQQNNSQNASRNEIEQQPQEISNEIQNRPQENGFIRVGRGICNFFKKLFCCGCCGKDSVNTIDWIYKLLI